MNKKEFKKYFNKIAPERDKWKKRNKYYYQNIKKLLEFLVPKNSSVLEIGCGTGDILAGFTASRAKGIDFSGEMIKLAKKKNPGFDFQVMDAENLSINEKYDYIIMSDLVGSLTDIQKAFQELHKVTDHRSRVIITYYNYLWEPILKLAEKLHLKMPQPSQSWSSRADIETLLYLSGFETVKRGERLLVPKFIPFVSYFCNRYLANLPFLRNICLVYYLVARPQPNSRTLAQQSGVSIIIPARNEKGNIESAIQRIPAIGSSLEVIFVEGHSTDDTLEEIKRVKRKYSSRNIKVYTQEGAGKGDAVRKGFREASGDILMILDADLTVSPEDLPKFYRAIVDGKGDFINGCRLVYPLADQSMRLLNIFGNKFFSLVFSWLLDQRIKDTLCGTKVLWKKDYERIEKGRAFFGDFDPFGDFDLLFGAAKLNLKIVDLPIRYQERTYGTTNINRFRHGWLLLRMCFFAMNKMKFL